MKTIFSGDMYYGKTIDLHCVLGSCVGIFILHEGFVGITHGNNPTNTASMIKDMLNNFSGNYKVILGGGMEGFIGRANLKAAKNVLKGVEYIDITGELCTIIINNGKLIIKKNGKLIIKKNGSAIL